MDGYVHRAELAALYLEKILRENCFIEDHLSFEKPHTTSLYYSSNNHAHHENAIAMIDSHNNEWKITRRKHRNSSWQYYNLLLEYRG